MDAAIPLPLRAGGTMPPLGLGTATMSDETAENAVRQALRLGYRMVDTAELYQNERGVGVGLRTAGLPRDEIFVITKFNKQWHGAQLVARACEASLDRLGLDYVDLLLIHWPIPQQDRYVEAWRGMIALRAAGLVRSIGTSNFKPSHLDRIVAETGVRPDVNQIQLSPALTREGARRYHAAHGIVTQSWSPLGGDRFDVVHEPVITEIAERHNRTPAQVVLRWHIELGLVPIPRSVRPHRLRENFEIFDFSLAAEEVAAICGLDRGESAAADSDAEGN